jgi:hypothetical protein
MLPKQSLLQNFGRRADTALLMIKLVTRHHHTTAAKHRIHVCLQVWPLLVDYFYRDSITINEGNALALLSLSRQLLVSSVDAYCLEFIGQHLDTSNCIRYLRKAVKHNISDIQQQCVALAAQGAGRFVSLRERAEPGRAAGICAALAMPLPMPRHCALALCGSPSIPYHIAVGAHL